MFFKDFIMVRFLIHRPVAVLMSTLAFLMLGLYAYQLIPVSLMPDVDVPEITVQVSADNLSARQMEDAVVRRLRGGLQQVSHLRSIESEAGKGFGRVLMKFEHGTNIDYAFIEVNEKIDRVVGGLSREIKRPQVIKASAADIPVFYLNLTLKERAKTNLSENRHSDLFPVSQEFVEFSRFADQVVKKRLEQLNEVAMVDISGLVASEVLIIPDQKKMQSMHISLGELENLIKKNDLDIGSLLVHEAQYQYSIRLGTKVRSVDALRKLYLKKGERIFQLKDIAEVLSHPQQRKGLVLSEGTEGLTMAVIKQQSARMADMKASLRKLVRQLEKDYPNVSFKIARDQTQLLDYAIGNLSQSLLWGILLAFFVMFFFLKDLKAPLLIGIALPVSLVVCLLFFQQIGISINIISLSGLVLGIGLMIDNSIIVIDNISQHRERGLGLNDACVKGTMEVFRPLLSSMLTTCAVFIPLIFISGIAGSLFYDQAMSISIGLLVSLIVSILLLPVLYRLFYLKKEGRIFKNVSLFLKKRNTLDYEALYEKGFQWVMRNQRVSWALTVALLLGAYGLFAWLPKSQLPDFTRLETLAKIDWNEEIHVEENKRRVLELLAPLKEGLEYNAALVGTQQFMLESKGKAKVSEFELYLKTGASEQLRSAEKSLRKSLKDKYPDALLHFEDVENIFSMIFSDKEPPLVARLRSTRNLGVHQSDELQKVHQSLKSELADTDVDDILWEEQVVAVADREKLLSYDIPASSLKHALSSAFRAYQVLELINNQEFIPVVLGTETQTMEEILSETMIRGRDSVSYQLRDFIRLERSQGLKNIRGGKEGEYFPVVLELKPEQVPENIRKIRASVSRNKWYEVNFSGSFFNDQVLMGELQLILLVSVLLLYFILASQFESFVLPLIILLEVPLDLAGAFLFLKLFGMSVNLMSMIGIVVMCGIIINDSILKIDTVIQLRREGYGLLKALLVAGQRRLKPILMTSLTTILALIPLLFTAGLGAELQAPLAVAMIGGMLQGTLVSLYFIPLCYYQISKK